MKRDEVKELFPSATDEDIDALLNKVGEELNPLRRQLREAQSERDEAKSALSASQAAEASSKSQLEDALAKLEEGMSAEERIAAREKAAEDREREFGLKSNGLDAKEIFVAAGCFEADEIDELVAQVVTVSAEDTKARAQRIVDTVLKQREAVKKATEDELLKSNPKPDGGGDGSSAPTSKKEFLALDYEQQLALKQADPSILTRLK